ncbi:DNA-(apurinic or apyrimidinic site) lyase [Trifolium repens]|nr:DNA-(apurinic or apyrimidinic site) lyase [Trifolium repens]
MQCHSFIRCHVKECEILTQYKRCKPESTLSAQNWKGGQSVKLEGSDHAPVLLTLMEIPEVSLHNTPSLSARYVPMIRGVQQTLVSLLMKRRVSELCKMEHGDIVTVSTCERKEEPVDKIGSSTCGCDVLPSQDSDGSNLKPNELSPGSSQETSKSGSVLEKSITQKCNESKKKARNSQSSQLSIRSFFQKSTNLDNGVKDSCIGFSNNQGEPSQPNTQLLETSTVFDDSSNPVQDEVSADAFDPDLAERNDSSRKEEKSNVASQEWQRIQKLMQSSIPLCKGHKEPCIARVVKKQGANFGRRFYTCTRAEGPASNPEANCGYFKWATSKSRNK